jgi:hypothetical protein
MRIIGMIVKLLIDKNMKTVNSSGELKEYLSKGEKVFLAGNKKMTVAFKVYSALGHSDREAIIAKPVNIAPVVGAISETTLITLAIAFCATIIAVVLIMSGRKGSVKASPDGPILTVD